MIKQFFILFSALFLGYIVTYYSGIPIPANVVGLVFLFAALCLGIVKIKHVEAVSDFIIKYLAVFFIVPTVGIMVYFDLISSQAIKILVPLVISILLGFFVAGKSTEITIKALDKIKTKKALKAGEK